MKKLFIAFFLSSLAHSFASKAPQMAPTTPTPVPVPKLKSLFPNQAWTDMALAEVLGARLAAVRTSDEFSFCPNGLTPRNWVHLLAAMAKYESGFDPKKEYRENFTGRDGKRIISTGLFQISLSSGNGYGCGFKTQADLKDPFQNIRCAVKILTKWVPKDGVVAAGGSNSTAKGGARYWSVLRTSGKLKEVKNTLKTHCE